MAAIEQYDVIIVGAGPVGFSCGIEAQQRGFRYLMIEKGCLVNSIFHFPTNMVFFSTSERLEIGNVPFISHGDKPTRREALEYYRRVVKFWNLDIHLYETVEFIEKDGKVFKVKTDKSEYLARAVVISTGFYDHPNRLNVPGEELPKVKHYFDEPHPYAYQKIAVIGGGNSAVDVALETFRRGAEVTMIIREASLKPGIKYWVKPDIENRIKEGSIKAYFNSVVKEIREEEIEIQTPRGNIILLNDFVFAMTGYHPDYSFLKRIGVQILEDEFRTPYYNKNTFESNVEGVFLAGVVCGGLASSRWTLENSKIHAEKIMDTLAARFSE